MPSGLTFNVDVSSCNCVLAPNQKTGNVAYLFGGSL
jgi:hypothetical protein